MSRPIIQQWAGHYITNMEWPVVPLEPRSKACLARGWTQRTFQLHDFRHDSNIGIKSVSGLVVLDDDFPTPAVGCADDLLLPSTSWGRPLKPRSKRIYRCPELEETTTYTDLDGSHLVQLRVGMQDMAPPSIHPTTGEKLQWDGLLIEPAHVDVETLVDAARQYWTARLIAKYWPIRTRHECRLAYARVLLETLEIPDDTAVHILEWACRLGGSDERGINNVRAAVRDTRAKLEAGEATTGGKTVGRLLPDGPRIVRLLRKGYDKTSAVADAVDRLNDRFAIVNVSNKVVVMETWPDGGIKSLWSFPEFQNLLIKESVKVAGKDRPLANIWLKRPDGRQYDRLVYVMPGSSEQCHPDDYNGWLGLTVEPQPGDWSRNRDHLLNVICGGNQGYYDWVFGWVAALVQWPGRHAMTAIVLRGGQGTGKGHFAHRMLGLLFHKQQYLHIIGAEALTGRFNEHLSGKVLVFADESTWGGDPKAAERLKGMVTESTVNIERKFLPLVEEPSALHIIMASNNDWPVAIPPTIVASSCSMWPRLSDKTTSTFKRFSTSFATVVERPCCTTCWLTALMSQLCDIHPARQPSARSRCAV